MRQTVGRTPVPPFLRALSKGPMPHLGINVRNLPSSCIPHKTVPHQGQKE